MSSNNKNKEVRKTHIEEAIKDNYLKHVAAKGTQDDISINYNFQNFSNFPRRTL
jgi:hypothetical protein